MEENAWYESAPPYDRRLSIVADDDQVYEDYVERTRDPGSTLFVIALFICLSSIAGLPLFVRLGRWIDARAKEAGGGGGLCSEESSALVAARDGEGGSLGRDEYANLTFLQRCRSACRSACGFVLNHSVRWRHRTGGAHAGENAEGRMEGVSRGVAREARESMYRHAQEDAAARLRRMDGGAPGLQEAEEEDDDEGAARLRHLDTLTKVDLEGTVEISLSPTSRHSPLEATEQEEAQARPSPGLEILDDENNQLEVYDEANGSVLPTSEPPICSVAYVRKSMLFMWTIFKYDNETHRILRLAIPFTCSAVTETTSDLVILAIISQYLGTDNMVAYGEDFYTEGLHKAASSCFVVVSRSLILLLSFTRFQQWWMWSWGLVQSSCAASSRPSAAWEAQPSGRQTTSWPDSTCRLPASCTSWPRSQWPLFGEQRSGRSFC